MSLASKKYLFLFAAFLVTTTLNAQEPERSPFFIGLEVSAITKEKHYEDDEFDVNFIPLVFQGVLGKRMDIRLTTIFNYHTGSNPGMGDIGLYSVFPLYFKKKESKSTASSGLYIGPVIGFTNNDVNRYHTMTTALEFGYMFRTSKKFTLGAGMQFGASYFNYSYQENKWVDHLGLKVNLGFWF